MFILNQGDLRGESLQVYNKEQKQDRSPAGSHRWSVDV